MKNLNINSFKPSIFGASILTILTVLVYYFSNNTAQIVLFEVFGAAVSVAVLFFSLSFFLKDFIQKPKVTNTSCMTHQN